jgi:hypothetical protein
MEEALSLTIASSTLPPSTTRNGRPRGTASGPADPLVRPKQRQGRSAPHYSTPPSSPQGSQETEAQAQKPRRRHSREVLETIIVKLFQDENALGPRLKPDEEYVGSLLSKYGDVIFHNYRRENVSPDDPPPTPHLKI